MPKLVLEIPDTVESVIRPVVMDITRELQRVTGISDKTRIYFPGEANTAYQAGSAIGAQELNPRLPGDGRITMTVDESFDENEVLAAAVYQPEQLFVFKDEALETHIKPAYAKSLVTINFEYRAKDKTEALKWRDSMKTRLSMGREQYLHDVTYHFMIPEEFLAILQEIHRLREAVAGYGENWETYFAAKRSSRVSEITTLSGNRTVWAVAETQKRIVGVFTFDVAPEKGEKNAEGETWNVSISYKFQFERPVACVMHYPLVVHNQVLSQKWRPSKTDLVRRWEDTHSRRSLSSAAFAAFEAGRWTSDQRHVAAPGRTVPEYDEFLPVDVPARTMRIFTSLVTIDTDPAGDPLFLLDLNDITRNWKLDPGVLAYMRLIHDRLHVPTRAPLLVSLYDGRSLLSGHHVRVDADLKVYSTTPLPLRSYYHVRLGLATHWSDIQRESLEPLRSDATTLLKLLSAVDSRSTLTKILSTGWVPKQTLDQAIDFLDRAQLAQGNGQIYQFNTVQALFVSVARKE